ncbi:hypothetical protein EJ08DRAFT_651654 [Tothia fuscella]|uniref:Uncharacterized protein n=1 Tax=Tothia fuscella TaxID=1048955 RepID=A0A9P4TWF0_9PEZI|nr:hypothetical protein EJ08DRAFT_651654 [Tothia fuscella]
MKTSFLPILCVLSSALAAPLGLVARETLVIENSIRTISASLQNLAAEIRALDNHRAGTPFNDHVALIKHHGDDLANSISRAAGDVRRAPNVNLNEANSLFLPVQNLADSTQRAVDAWIAAKNTVVRSGGQQVVVNIIRNQRNAGEEFTKAVVSKMPAAAAFVGQLYGDRVRASADLALRAYGERP